MSSEYFPAGQTQYFPSGQATPATPAPPANQQPVTPPPAPAPIDRLGVAPYMPSRGVNVYPHDIAAYVGAGVVGLAAGVTAAKGIVHMLRGRKV